MTRILSAFNLLKRVGFAVLVVWVTLAQAQPPDTVWARIYGEAGDEALTGLICLENSDFLMVGFISDSLNGESDGLILRVDSGGNIVWQERVGFPLNEVIIDAVEVQEEIFAVGNAETGPSENAEIWVSRIESDGDTIWSRTYGGPHENHGNAITALSNENLLVVGSTSLGLGSQVYAVKIDMNGDTLWSRTVFREESIGPDEAFDVIACSNGGYLVAGYRTNPPQFPNPLDRDPYLVRLSDEGDTLWTSAIANEGYREGAAKVVEVSTGFYIVAGMRESPEGTDIVLFEVDELGDTLWFRVFDQYGDDEILSSMLYRGGDRLVLHGSTINPSNPTRNWTFLAAYSLDGTLLGVQNFPEPVSYQSASCDIEENGNFYIGGNVLNSSEFTSDIKVVKTVRGILNNSEHGSTYFPTAPLISIYPNPANESAILQIESKNTQHAIMQIFSITGQNVSTNEIDLMPGSVFLPLVMQGYSSGIYYISIRTPSHLVSTRLVFLK